MTYQPTASVPLHRPWHNYLKFSTDHKVIGIQYLLMSFCFFLVAGLLAMIIRAELLTPNWTWWTVASTTVYLPSMAPL
ncbi:hypothetical protein NON20_22395 [Synechocystis sp. B12]|nr:hypothetical protein NON20_22395 [Synechocystis sp. B12]